MNDPAWIDRLLHLGHAVRAAVAMAQAEGEDLSAAVAHEGGDTIYAIDRRVEPVIEAVVTGWDTPLLLIAEGMGADGRKRIGKSPPACRVILDPIDGTRGLMYDKRSAWFLGAVAEDRGESTSLADVFAAAMVELPTSKAGWADHYAATRDGPVIGRRTSIGGCEQRDIAVSPSRADTLMNGYAQVSNFFPGTKVLASELMERIAEATVGSVVPGTAALFDDQYASTGGQMLELALGRDRFCCDLRPLFYRINGVNQPGLECHPYDAAAALVAERAGVIITDGFGRDLAPPLDVHSPVHWCGYANESLRSQVEPVIQSWLREKGIEAP